MAGNIAERQENKFIDEITSAIKLNGKSKSGITLIGVNNIKINNVIQAKKQNARTSSGNENYTDVILTLNNNQKLNISMKGTSAASFGGGGLSGLEKIIPGIATKFLKQVYKKLKKSLKCGDKVPDQYGAITEAQAKKIIKGNKAVGGPIDYVYVGPMELKADFDKAASTLTFNGSFFTPVAFAKEHPLFLRLRARREDQTFDPSAMDKNGTPKIYGTSCSRGDSAGRIVMTKSVPKNAEAFTIDLALK